MVFHGPVTDYQESVTGRLVFQQRQRMKQVFQAASFDSLTKARRVMSTG